MATLTEAFNTALALHRQGRYDQAEDIYRRILAVEPAHAASWHLLGVLAHQRGDPRTAIELIQRAIGLDGARPVYYGNLGASFRQAGQFDDALRVLRKALELAPDFAVAHTNLALTLTELDRAEEALPHFRRAMAGGSADAALTRGFTFALAETGRTAEAAAVFDEAIRALPDPMLRVLRATLLPLVYASSQEVVAARERLEAHVDRLLAEGVQVDIADEFAAPVFSLAHQGFNDRGLQTKLVRLFRPPPDLPLPPTPRQQGLDPRIRVGFASAYFNRHTIGKLAQRLIAGLDRREFQVVVLSQGEHHDHVAEFIRGHADEYRLLPRRVATARQIVADARVDVLFYVDLGMSALTYTLAYSRLAPVQCLTWGHPSTTGLPTMDYFLSSAAMETPEADEHYTEKLVRLPSLTFDFQRPLPPAELLPRAAFGLDEGKHLYVCPQSIYKFHPDFDPLLAEILRRDPAGEVVVIRWAYDAVDDLLRARFRRTLPDVADRVRFINRVQPPQFLNLLAVSDVLLDPLHFGGGMTSLEGISLGVPIVTLPGPFLRSRITQALLRRIGLEECIVSSPAEYAALAVRLGTDRDYRQSIAQRIRDAAEQLFGDTTAVRAAEDFFRRAVAEADGKV